MKLNTSLMITILIVGHFAPDVFAGESIEDIKLRREIINSQSNSYITGLHIASSLFILSPFLMTRGFTQYNTGKKLKKLEKPFSHLAVAPQLKRQGLRNATLGSLAILPFAAFYYDLNKIMQEKKHKLSFPSILVLEETGKTSPASEKE